MAGAAFRLAGPIRTPALENPVVMFPVSKPSMAAAFVAILCLLSAGANVVHAQGAPGVHQDNSGINGSLSREDLEKLGGTYKNDTSADVPKDPILARAKARAQSLPLLLSLRISCEVSDAKLVVVGTRRLKSGGRDMETRVYEVACSDGMGYLLETAGKEMPIAISCLDAEEPRMRARARRPVCSVSSPATGMCTPW
jgi:hypothetical protein